MSDRTAARLPTSWWVFFDNGQTAGMPGVAMNELYLDAPGSGVPGAGPGHCWRAVTQTGPARVGACLVATLHHNRARRLAFAQFGAILPEMRQGAAVSPWNKAGSGGLHLRTSLPACTPAGCG